MPEEQRRTILCVDDEQDVVDTLFDTFMDSYDVKTATSGEQALKIFDNEDISLVISDQRMPEMEGTDLLAKINEKKPICKKILLTGYADINAAIDAINLGSVDRYFSKPWDDAELIKAVDDLLAMYKTDEFLARVIQEAEGLKEEAVAAKRTRLFEEFLDSFLKGVCVVGPDRNIEYVNQKGLELTGYNNLTQLQGKDFRDVFPLDEKRLEVFWKRHYKKDPSSDELEIILRDGSSARVQASMSFRVGEAGIQVCGIVFDPA